MTLSREVINPRFPRNISDLKYEGYSDAKIPMGHLAVRTGPRAIVECDAIENPSAQDYQPHTSNTHLSSAVEAIWIDPDRFDVPFKNMSGTQKYQMTTLAGNIVCDVDESTVFEPDGKSPAEGDIIIKSLFTAGKMQAVDRATLDAILTNGTQTIGGVTRNFQNFNPSDLLGLRVGTVFGSGDGAGMVRIRLAVV